MDFFETRLLDKATMPSRGTNLATPLFSSKIFEIFLEICFRQVTQRIENVNYPLEDN